MSNKLGSYIKQKRGDESLRKLAKRCGVSHTLIDTLEKGYDPRTQKPAKPTVDSLKKIASGLGINVIELLLLAVDEEYTEISPSNSPTLLPDNFSSEDLELLEIARKFNSLPPEKKKAIKVLIEIDKKF
ncbi:helix-turn-helix domain-containing protein [Sporomusa termitida]|uniref:HTH cro/C1-type domain-containing protein n=1 Tax=Sporomusa termitida TaxID=2377 RepID=A0A517DWS8_9FIRM|nr:helix-turn-helix transcriptional regulator [Sporomusa termitida]QDR81797.1 hypothetical protein SPTER_32110 [Sporomusa termitida]